MVNGRVYIQHHMKQATQFSAFPDKGAGLHVAEQKKFSFINTVDNETLPS